MKQVSKEAFFEALHAQESVGHDIMPCIKPGKWDECKGYVSEWKYKRTNRVFGVTWGQTGHNPSREYMLNDNA